MIPAIRVLLQFTTWVRPYRLAPFNFLERQGDHYQSPVITEEAPWRYQKLNYITERGTSPFHHLPGQQAADDHGEQDAHQELRHLPGIALDATAARLREPVRALRAEKAVERLAAARRILPE